jgi:signal transduction histidine kinase
MINEIENLNEGTRIILQISKSFPREPNIYTTFLYHIASNLLSNAIKYSDPDKMVSLKLNYEEENLIVYGKDFGTGTSKKNHKKYSN